MHDPEQVNAVKCQPLDGDDHPTQITAYQAQKCAAIVEAYADGQALYREHVNTVAKFLKTAALEAALGHGYSRPTAQTIWQHIEHLPWPRHGGARRQAELWTVNFVWRLFAASGGGLPVTFRVAT